MPPNIFLFPEKLKPVVVKRIDVVRIYGEAKSELMSWIMKAIFGGPIGYIQRVLGTKLAVVGHQSPSPPPSSSSSSIRLPLFKALRLMKGWAALALDDEDEDGHATLGLLADTNLEFTNFASHLPFILLHRHPGTVKGLSNVMRFGDNKLNKVYDVLPQSFPGYLNDIVTATRWVASKECQELVVALAYHNPVKLVKALIALTLLHKSSTSMGYLSYDYIDIYIYLGDALQVLMLSHPHNAINSDHTVGAFVSLEEEVVGGGVSGWVELYKGRMT